MRKNLLLSILFFSGITVFSQTFNALYPFSSVTATTGMIDPTPPPTGTGVTFGAFTAVGTSSNPSAGGVFSFSSWDLGATNADDINFTGSLNSSKYYEVTITPSSGFQVDLTSITFNMNRSGTGPRNWAVRSDKDSYTNNLPASVVSNTATSVVGTNVFFWNIDTYTTTIQQKGQTITLSGSNFTAQTSPYTFRFYAWNAEGTGGTFRVDTVIFNGMAWNISGVKEFGQDLNSAIKIYPNPSNDGTVYLDPKKINYSKIEVLNILGNVASTENFQSLSNEKIKLNLNSLSSGTYFIRVTSGTKVYTERFFISK